ncbi:MAG: hypothetical protein ACI85Z_000953, partial [Rheinheimera aquimaris]
CVKQHSHHQRHHPHSGDIAGHKILQLIGKTIAPSRRLISSISSALL